MYIVHVCVCAAVILLKPSAQTTWHAEAPEAPGAICTKARQEPSWMTMGTCRIEAIPTVWTMGDWPHIRMEGRQSIHARAKTLKAL